VNQIIKFEINSISMAKYLKEVKQPLIYHSSRYSNI